jgi:hypothetical protein
MLKVAAPALLLALAACTADDAAPQLSQAQQRALEGRAVGEPQLCISSRDIDDTDAVTDRVVLFHMKNGRTYRSDLPMACPRLDRPNTAYSHRSITDRLCNVDVIQLFDPVGGFSYGSCQLGKFVEYELPEGVNRNSL